MRLPPGLVAITPGTLEDPAAALAAIERAVAAGLRGVLVREPRLSDRGLVGLARAVRAALEREAPDGVWLAVHDRLHLAPAAGADAVHVGFRSLPLAEARRVVRALPGEVALGFSAHESDAPGAWAEADYVTFGPVLATPSKVGLVEATGFEGLARAVERDADLPVHALGGLGPEHVARAREAGARGVFVLRGVLGAPDPAEATRAYLAALGEGAP